MRNAIVVTAVLALGLSACAGGPKRPGAQNSQAQKTLFDRCRDARNLGEPTSAECVGVQDEQGRRLPPRLPTVDMPSMPAPAGALGSGGLGGLRR